MSSPEDFLFLQSKWNFCGKFRDVSVICPWKVESLRASEPAGRSPRGAPLLRCRSSTMAPHRLHRDELHLPARRSRQNATFIPDSEDRSNTQRKPRKKNTRRTPKKLFSVITIVAFLVFSARN
jgi:hypothetical protein